MMTTEKTAVISVGRIYCDLIFTGLDELPVLGRELFARDMEIAAGGGAFIAAAHFAHIGRPVALLARLGTDTFSRDIGEKMARSGVDLQFLEHSADAGPQVTVATVVGQDRAFLTRRAGAAQPSTLDAAFAWENARHLHIAEFATLHEMPDLVSRAKASGLSVSLDPSWDASLIYDKGLLQACAGVDVFLPNLEEAEAITGHSDPEIAIRALSEAFPVVALKGGAQGAWVSSQRGLRHVAAQKVPVIDTTGAGDAFNAGFLDAWLEGQDEQRCLKAGVAAGSLAVQAAGGAPRETAAA
ncbi:MULTISPECIES: carbohydrate kinase family protein [Agrobacterium]|uniref:carbohydrate kinase family protein n=1 Tax=Agrobacterium TaxID=357 RepID=UPI0022B81151|nr:MULTISPECIES: sugar kinase [Agrobacterium]MCZ7887254.1 sugar kinase [Agrobacterium salinitolerans]MDA5628750.1 sugar kinase [Agrobacterium sp. ST15.16.055]MDA6980482.1 sugar kinase [Agrobacterium salinitolerans]